MISPKKETELGPDDIDKLFFQFVTSGDVGSLDKILEIMGVGPRTRRKLIKKAVGEMNKNNLKKIDSSEMAKSMGAKGGKASGESRRKRKTLRQAMQAILASEIEPGKTGVEVLAMSLFNAAKDGDVKALEKIHAMTDLKRDNQQTEDEYNDLYVLDPGQDNLLVDYEWLTPKRSFREYEYSE